MPSLLLGSDGVCARRSSGWTLQTTSFQFAGVNWNSGSRPALANSSSPKGRVLMEEAPHVIEWPDAQARSDRHAMATRGRTRLLPSELSSVIGSERN